jgi:hypothetical protein
MASGMGGVAIGTRGPSSKLPIRASTHLPWCGRQPATKTLAAVVSAPAVESTATAAMGTATTSSRTAAMGATTAARASSVMLTACGVRRASKSYGCDSGKEEI